MNKIFQARQSLEKAKALLEEERQNLTSELKSLQTGRMESERGRKKAESQLQELNARLAQADREREDREERVQKLQVQTHLNTLTSNLFVPRIKSAFPSEGTFGLMPVFCHFLQSEIETVSSSLSSSETKSLRFSKEVNSLESQLNDAKVANKTRFRIGFM